MKWCITNDILMEIQNAIKNGFDISLIGNDTEINSLPNIVKKMELFAEFEVVSSL